MELNSSLATNDVLRGATVLNFGGTLSLTNLAGALGTNDSFKLFFATTYAGAFAAIVPATPGPGLAWSTNTLATDGTLRIVATTVSTPYISSVTVSGTNLLIQGTNGTASGPYYVLAGTNLALPLSNWTRMSTNAFDLNGAFSFTNTIDPLIPQQFYLLQLP
jgi:hypothetical protein